MPFRRKPRNKPRGNNNPRGRKPPTRNTNRGRSLKNIHIPSERIFRQTLRTNHNVVEKYPLNLGDLVDLTNIGGDVDVKLVGYTLSVHLATGNNTDTVTCGVAHQGPWVRHGPSDGFNQQFVPKNFRRNRLTFRKSLLPTSERQYLNPHRSNPGTEQNQLVLKIIDPCGVIPGVTCAIFFKAHFIRPYQPVSVYEGNTQALDLYEDQDVSTGASPAPQPPVAFEEVPGIIQYKNGIGDDKVATAQILTDTTVKYLFEKATGTGRDIQLVVTTVDKAQKTATLDFNESVAGSTQQNALKVLYARERYSGSLVFTDL